MLLRSSSTPLLGSLLSSFPETPATATTTTTNTDKTSGKHPPTTTSHNYHNLCFHQSGSLYHNSFSIGSSPISPSVSEFSDVDRKGFRRAQSEGNLEGLGHNFDELSQHKFSRTRPSCSVLDTIPSFSFYNSKGVFEDDVEGEEESDEEEIVSKMGIEEKKSGSWDVGFGKKGSGCSGLYLAKGLGVDVGVGVDVDTGGSGGFGGGCGGGFRRGNSGRDDEDDWDRDWDVDLEEYYRRMVEENPTNTLFLRNYAHFLYQSKGDLNRAEEYYSRAILTDPNDGEILSQYAKLVWELHGDQDRATGYFELAVQTAPQDSHVLASYAGFLWEAEEDEDEVKVSVPKDNDAAPPQFHTAAMASASA